MTPLLQVALGGALGASARYLTNAGVMRVAGPGFPFGTIVANALGSFLMGFLVVLLARRGGMEFAPFLMTGLLGGFTTFSAFSLDALTLYQRGEVPLSVLYVIGSVVLALGAIVLGIWVARGVVPA